MKAKPPKKQQAPESIEITTDNHLYFKDIDKVKEILRAINKGVRMDIIRVIGEYGELTVTEIYCKVRCKQSVASAQLSVLRSVGIVKAKRGTENSRFIYYSLNAEMLNGLKDGIEIILGNK